MDVLMALHVNKIDGQPEEVRSYIFLAFGHYKSQERTITQLTSVYFIFSMKEAWRIHGEYREELSAKDNADLMEMFTDFVDDIPSDSDARTLVFHGLEAGAHFNVHDKLCILQEQLCAHHREEDDKEEKEDDDDPHLVN